MMGKVAVNDLATRLIDSKGLSKKQAASFVNGMFDIIQKGLEKDKAVKVKGLGTFKIISVDDRESINVNTGERVLIEGHSKITFTPDSVMKELVNKPFSQFETVVLKDGVDFEDMPASEENEAASAPLVDFGAKSETVQEEPVILREEPIIEEQKPLIEEQKPLIEEQVPLIEEEKPLAEEQEPLIETPAEEPVNEEEEDIIYDDDSAGGWKKWILPIVCCLIGFAAGYFVANMVNSQSAAPEQLEQVEVTQPEPQTQPVVADSIKQQEEAAEDSLISEPVIEEEPKAEAKPEPKPEVKPEPASAEPDKYEKMDPRVLHGAYRIVGTDHVEKIKETDNLARICKRTIGPGMECYLEVYNGIKGDADLKPGKEIKIPKLELKKKNKKIRNIKL